MRTRSEVWKCDWDPVCALLTGLICMMKMLSLKLLSEICFRSFSSTRYFRASVLGSNTMNEVPVTTRTMGTPLERWCVCVCMCVCVCVCVVGMMWARLFGRGISWRDIAQPCPNNTCPISVGSHMSQQFTAFSVSTFPSDLLSF